MDWKKDRKFYRIGVDVTGTQLARFQEHYQHNKYDIETIKLMEKIMLKILSTYMLGRELEDIHRTQETIGLDKIYTHKKTKRRNKK